MEILLFFGSIIAAFYLISQSNEQQKERDRKERFIGQKAATVSYRDSDQYKKRFDEDPEFRRKMLRRYMRVIRSLPGMEQADLCAVNHLDEILFVGLLFDGKIYQSYGNYLNYFDTHSIDLRHSFESFIAFGTWIEKMLAVHGLYTEVTINPDNPYQLSLGTYVNTIGVSTPNIRSRCKQVDRYFNTRQHNEDVLRAKNYRATNVLPKRWEDLDIYTAPANQAQKQQIRAGMPATQSKNCQEVMLKASDDSADEAMDEGVLPNIFKPDMLKSRVHIIGSGAISHAVAESLVRLGVTQISIYHFDPIETRIDAGREKLDKLAKYLCHINLELMEDLVLVPDGWNGRRLAGYVFLCTNNMGLHHEIATAFKDSKFIKAMFDFRISASGIKHFAADWSNKKMVEDFINDMNVSCANGCNAETSFVATPTQQAVIALGITNFANFVSGNTIIQQI